MVPLHVVPKNRTDEWEAMIRLELKFSKQSAESPSQLVQGECWFVFSSLQLPPFCLSRYSCYGRQRRDQIQFASCSVVMPQASMLRNCIPWRTCVGLRFDLNLGMT